MRHFNTHDLRRNAFMLDGKFKRRGYDWWWHSFTAVDDVTGEEVPFFIEYFLCNPALSPDKVRFGQKNLSGVSDGKPCYLMVKAGCWGKSKRQLHRLFPISQVALHKSAPYSVQAADCYADDLALRGSVCVSSEDAAAHPEWMCDAGEMSWNLTLDKQVAFNVGYGASGIFRFLKAFEMYWHAEGMKTLYSGTVTMDGRRFTVKPESSYGYADKNWGSGFTSPWVWLSSNDLVSNVSGKRLCDSVFDIGGGRPKVFGVALERKLLSAFWYEGRPFEFNFSKFWTGCRTVFSSEQTDELVKWHVRQENNRAVMETEICCRKEDMLWVNYEDPDGNKRFAKLWNGGNGEGNVRLFAKRRGKLELIDDIKVAHVGCEYGEFEG